MSINKMKLIFQGLYHCTGWSLQLLKINSSKRTGTDYCGRQITLVPGDRLANLLNETASIYLGNGKKGLDSYREVRPYDGTADALVIYTLDTSDPLISMEYEKLIQRIANPEQEGDPFAYISAHLFKGVITLNGEDIPVKLVSMQNPTTILKHKFSIP